MTGFRLLPFALALLSVAGCSSDEPFKPAPPFDKLADVRVWATSASAVGVYSNVSQVIAVADGQEKYKDAACPVLSDDGTTFTATGDCQDSDGHDWKGKATLTRDGDDRSLSLSNFEGDKGTFTLHQVKPELHEFEAHLQLGGVTTIDYSGSVQGDYGIKSTWNGSGHVKREGFFAPTGAVDATTIDEVVDDAVCRGQPASGTTTLKEGGDTAVVSYDGDSDCDSDQKAQVSVNGVDRGLVDGISCAVRASGAVRGSNAFALSLVLSLVLLRLRRRSDPTISRAARSCAAPLARSATYRCTG